jgi:hypothetical protein
LEKRSDHVVHFRTAPYEAYATIVGGFFAELGAVAAAARRSPPGTASAANDFLQAGSTALCAKANDLKSVPNLPSPPEGRALATRDSGSTPPNPSVEATPRARARPRP